MKKVAVLFSEGFEEIEGLTVVDILRRGNIKCDMVALGDLNVLGAHNILVKCDVEFSEELRDYDLIVLPGGMPGAINLKEDERVISLIQYFNDNNKLIGAICAAPIVFQEAKIIKGRKITSYPTFKEALLEGIYLEDKVVVDGNMITSRGAGTAMDFAFELLSILGKEEEAKSLKESMLY